MNVLNLRISPARLAPGIFALLVSISTVVGAQAPAIDPVAVKILQNMTDYVSGLQQFSVHTENTYEDQLDSGQRVDLDIGADVTVRRPNKLHAARSSDLNNQNFYYVGKTLTLYNSSKGVYASQPAPKTIEELLDYAREDLGVIVPAADLAYRGVYDILMQGCLLYTSDAADDTQFV